MIRQPAANRASFDAAPVSDHLLFEAAEAWIRAIRAIDPEQLDDQAIAAALRTEALAPFDLRETTEAFEFLERLGLLDA